MSLKAIVFDFDGTMLNTEMAIYEAWREVYSRYGHDLSLEQWQRVVGAPAQAFDPHKQLEELVGRPIARDVVHPIRLQREREAIARMPLQPGVMDLMQSARDRGIGLGIASNSDMGWVHSHVSRLGIADYFTAICTVDQVERPKPDPDLYVLAAERLGVLPRDAVAIEDSPIGAQSSIGAGMTTIAVPIALTRNLDFPPVALTIESLDQITLDDLIQLNVRHREADRS